MNLINPNADSPCFKQEVSDLKSETHKTSEIEGLMYAST